jgi:hypothetical protein
VALEGIVSKRKDSAYRSGRSPDWLLRGGRNIGFLDERSPDALGPAVYRVTKLGRIARSLR